MDIRRKDDAQTGNNQGEAQASGGASGTGGGSGVLSTVLVIFVLVALVGLGFYFAGGDIGNGSSSNIDGTVAVVNGEEIDGSELEEQLEGFRNSTSTQAQQFNDLSETRQQEILLEGIINTELQLQAAQGAGVTVSDEEVDSELQARIDQIGQEEFEDRLETSDITRQEVRDDLRNQMIVNAYIQQEAGGEITATDEEIQQLYQQYTTQIQQSAGTSTDESAVPALEELRPQIEAAVIQQKQQQTAMQLLEQARENAEIEVLLEGVSYPASSEAAPAAGQQPAQPGTGTAPGTGQGESGAEVPTPQE